MNANKNRVTRLEFSSSPGTPGEGWGGGCAERHLVGRTFLSAIESASGGILATRADSNPFGRDKNVPPLTDSKQTRMSAPPPTRTPSLTLPRSTGGGNWSGRSGGINPALHILLIVVLAIVVGTQASAAEKDLPITGSHFAGLDPFDKLMTDFVKDHDVPGASLAVTRNGHLIYGRGFGFADREHHQAVEPRSLFRIASISKPFTSAAIMQLVEKGKLRLDDHPFEMLHLDPHLERGAKEDPRLNKITILHLLQHTGGFDRDKSFDPMFRPIVIARALGVNPPAGQVPIIRYMMGRELDFDPGTRESYSNFGYCVLGRVVEHVSGESYEKYVREHMLAPLDIHSMRLGHTLPKDRAPGEVIYYDEKNRAGGSVFAAHMGDPVPAPYGAWNLEAMDSHGGWIASAVDLVRFASSFDDPAHSRILSAKSIETTFARPLGAVGESGDGKPKAVYYGCGWQVRHVGNGRINTWHNGALDGTSTLLVRRADGLCWAVLFNTTGAAKSLSGLIDGKVHNAADQVKKWPDKDLFDTHWK